MTTPDSNARLTIPNLITLVRILLTPLFIICLIQKRYEQALWVFLLAGLTDVADGLVARLWQQKSPLGMLLDPLADKLLMSSAYVTLSILRLIPPWLTVVVLSRDVVLVLGVIVFRLAEFPLVIQPSLAGKLATALQVAAVLLVLIGQSWGLPPPVLMGWFGLTGSLTVLSGVHYILRALKSATQTLGKEG